MVVKNLFCFLFFVIVFKRFSNCDDFGYDGNEGPTYWGNKYQQCIGKHQSPIDIESHRIKEVTFPPLIFRNFNKILHKVNVQNNGHTIVMTIKEGDLPTLSGGPLKATYGFSQLHFHWGPNDTLGSENKINHQSFPLELHVVMYNLKYNDFNEALKYQDGLTVLAFLYSIIDKNNTNYIQFEQALDDIHNLSASKDINNFVSLNNFTFISRDEYFAYNGSLTTPPCSEVVTWIEFKNTIPLSKQQVHNFRLTSHKGGALTHNYRPIQELYDRIIYFNKSPRQKRSPTLETIMFLFVAVLNYAES